MKYKKFVFTSVAAAALGLVAYLGVSKGTVSPQAQTILAAQEESELSCYPKRYAKPDQLSKYPFGGTIYYEVQAISKGAPKNSSVQILYFRTSPKGCEFLNGDSPVGSRLLYMPKPVALHFARLQYQPRFDRCLKQNSSTPDPKAHCVKIFEEAINVAPELLSEGYSFLYPEEVEVLNQIGIKTDKALVITKSSDLEKARRKQLQRHR